MNVFEKYNALRSNKYVIAVLNLISYYESGGYGHKGLEQYQVSWGGVLVDLKANAPKHPWPGGGCAESTALPRAVGRYQFCGYVWDEILTYQGLENLDFSNPVHQDVAAIARMDVFRKKLDLVLEGKMLEAIIGTDVEADGLSWEWAGLPPGRYRENRNVPIEPAERMLAEFLTSKLPSDGGDGTYKGGGSSSNGTNTSISSDGLSISTGPSSILGFNIETIRSELCYSMRFCKVLGGFVPTKAERILGGNPSLNGSLTVFSPGSNTGSTPGKMGKFTPKEGFINPCPSIAMNSPFGWRWGRMHWGLDFAGPIGTDIMASADGVVDEAGWNDGGYGNWVIIVHQDSPRTETLYGHMDTTPFVKKGDKVKQGQVIGPMGTTGFSTGPHLHFEIKLNGEKVDPAPLIGL
jgi:muramidase (phage lysozyme)